MRDNPPPYLRHTAWSGILQRFFALALVFYSQRDVQHRSWRRAELCECFLVYYAAVLLLVHITDLANPSVRPSFLYGLLTRRRRKTAEKKQIGVNVLQGRVILTPKGKRSGSSDVRNSREKRCISCVLTYGWRIAQWPPGAPAYVRRATLPTAHWTAASMSTHGMLTSVLVGLKEDIGAREKNVLTCIFHKM